MLSELRVKNLGIIEDITWRLRDGLNVVTGETGAGKSLIIDAVELLLSGKTDEDAIRYGANEAEIEGVFNLSQNDALSPLRALLSQKDLADGSDTLVIGCRLRRKLPGTVRVNGHAVSKALLHQIGRLLVDIHGQSQHLSLLDSKSHLDFLDAFAGTLGLRNDFAAKVAELRRMEQEMASLDQDERDRASREDFLRFQLGEIGRAKLRSGEEDELYRERSILSSAEKLKAFCYDAYRALYEEDGAHGAAPALDSLNEALLAMKRLAELDPGLAQQLKYLEDAILGLTEVARDVRAYGDRLHNDPQRLQEIESRLELIDGLKRKYGRSVVEVLDYQAKAEHELEGLTRHAERRAGMEQACSNLKQEMGRMACQLSQERSEAASRLADGVKKELNDLNMTQVEFEVSITLRPDPEGVPFRDGRSYAFSENGADIVEFMASTNPGEPLKTLASIASTGELSRFTLALKGALAEADSIPVLIFDEIDIGVGGRSGEMIGKKLWALGRDRQVVCVTHLPQIAAFADAHFGVHKTASGDRTLSVLETLDGEARTRELAAMLSGQEYGKTALGNAREIIRKADAWKRAHFRD